MRPLFQVRVNLSAHIDKKLFREIGQAAEELGVEVYAIGGMVRDILMKRPNKDFDFVTTGDGVQLAERVAERRVLAQQQPTQWLRPPF